MDDLTMNNLLDPVPDGLKYAVETKSIQDDLIAVFSSLPTEKIINIIKCLGVDIKDLYGKNIISIGEGIPFLAEHLVKNGSFVTAVDPLYSDNSEKLFAYAKKMLKGTESVLQYDREISQDNSVILQLKKMNELILDGEDAFYNRFFSSGNIVFNSSCADNIHDVLGRSQDYAVMAFLLNNLDTEDITYALMGSLETLKPGGQLIIIGPKTMLGKDEEFYHDYKTLERKYIDNSMYTCADAGDEYIGLRFRKN